MQRILLCSALLLASAAGAAAPQSTAHRPDIDKVNGGITAEAGQAYGELSSVNGSIALGQGASAEDVETVNGSIRAGEAVHANDVSTVNGGIRFGREARIDGGLETVNGDIFTDRGSQVRGGISTVNGSIGIIGTRVGGRIETVSGNITVGADSRVSGGLLVNKPTGNFGLRFGKQKLPRIVIGPNAVVEGPMTFEREVRLYVHSSASVAAISGAKAIRYSGSTPPQD